MKTSFCNFAVHAILIKEALSKLSLCGDCGCLLIGTYVGIHRFVQTLMDVQKHNYGERCRPSCFFPSVVNRFCMHITDNSQESCLKGLRLLHECSTLTGVLRDIRGQSFTVKIPFDSLSKYTHIYSLSQVYMVNVGKVL